MIGVDAPVAQEGPVAAHLLGPPAIDREFGTIDFLTLLDIEKMGRRLFTFFTLGLPRRSDKR